MFKNFLFLAIIFSSLLLHATPPLPPDFTGHFTFKGLSKKHAVFHLERIYNLFEEGQKREEELMAQGYICEPYGGNWTACRKVREDLEIPAAVINELTAPYLGRLDLEFGLTKAKPELVFESEFQWSWKLNQLVRLNQAERIQFQYLKMDNTEKIFVAGQEFLVRKDPKGERYYSIIDSLSLETDKKNGYYTYYLEMILQKIQ